jgi:hypothetical protein
VLAVPAADCPSTLAAVDRLQYLKIHHSSVNGWLTILEYYADYELSVHSTHGKARITLMSLVGKI